MRKYRRPFRHTWIGWYLFGKRSAAKEDRVYEALAQERRHNAILDGTLVTLENTETGLWVHDPDICAGQPCTVHNRSNHNMRDFPQHWRADRVIMERICPHGVGHPDPDEFALRVGADDGTHGCDGCCTRGPFIHGCNEDGEPRNDGTTGHWSSSGMPIEGAG